MSVRGSLDLLDRIRLMGFKVECLGTLWSLYRGQNGMHRKLVEAVAMGVEPCNQLPRPFKAVNPNAAKIAEATRRVARRGVSAPATPPSSPGALAPPCEEIVQRSQWRQAESHGAAIVAEA